MLKKIFRKLNIKESDYLVIGCSAGPDSMALLHYIQNNTKNKIVVAHINHNLRKESKKKVKLYIKKFFTYKNKAINNKQAFKKK